MICGFPYEKDSDIELTISFIKKNRKYISEIVLNKFFVDGLLQIHPEKYGIRLRKWKNIYRTPFTRAFDEINGLRWEEKIEQISKSYNKLKETFAQLNIPDMKPLHLIFHFINLQRN
jgi:hypothetical protein